MSDYVNLDVASEIDIMKTQLGVELDRELAAKLGIDPSAVAAWRRRNSIPEKYKLAYRRAGDERAIGGIPSEPIKVGRLREGYVFSLLEQVAKAPLPPDFEFLPEDWFLMWRGIRLANAFSYIQDKMPKTANKDELRSAYESVRSEIHSSDFLTWLESLS